MNRLEAYTTRRPLVAAVGVREGTDETGRQHPRFAPLSGGKPGRFTYDRRTGL
jgi:hypothetical protein